MQRSSIVQPQAPDPMRAVRRLLSLPDSGRLNGALILGSRGSGKSRLAGRAIIWQDFLREVPIILFDPMAGTLNNVLDKIIRLDEQKQRLAWQRVRYIDMAGTKTHVCSWPLLYAANSPYFAAQRFVELIRRTDPALASASVLGFNAFKKIATDVGMILYALGWQFSEADALLQNPRIYAAQIRDAMTRFPEIAEPAAYFLSDEYQKLSARDRDMQQSAFLRKLAPLSREPSMRAIFAAATPGFDWDEVVEKKLLVLLDFSHVPPSEKQFTLLWVYNSLIEWIQLKRGIGRHDPLSIVIDELTYMVGNRNQRDDVLARDLNQLISVISRNASLWLTIMSQELNQFSEEIQDVLMTLGTQIYGSTTDPKAAEKITRRFSKYDPYLIKREDNVWASDRGAHQVIDKRPVNFTVQEQIEINRRGLLELPRFTFLAGVARQEGTMPTALQRISIEQLDTGQYPQEGLIRQVKQQLMERDGQPIAHILSAIGNRTGAPQQVAPNRQPQITRLRPQWTAEAGKG